MCEMIKIFGHGESQNQQPLFPIEKVIPRLEEVYFTSDDIAMISDGQFAADFFGHIKVLGIFGYLNEPAVFPFSFLRRFYNLEMLEVGGCNFKDLSPYEVDVGEEKDEICALPQIKMLKLNGLYKITHLWKQDSQLDHIWASLETLEVRLSHSLINLASATLFFQNLTTLDVWRCGGMTELTASSQAQSLVCLVTIRIRECKMMTEIVSSEGDHEAAYEICFRKLKCLKLHCLESLKSFCLGNYTFNFPSLEQVILTQYPTLKNFCEGDLSTPKLQEVTETDYKGRWVGYLNATVQQLYIEQNVQISESLYLDDMKGVEILLHKSEGLPKLISFCSQDNGSTSISPQWLPLFNEKDIISTEEIKKEGYGKRAVISFPRLNSLKLMGLQKLIGFCLKDYIVEFQSLKILHIEDCPELKEFIINKSSPSNVLFNEKIAFPNLEKMTISYLKKRIWYSQPQLHGDSFCKLKELKVEKCDELLNIFP
ncbi:hypothetical protein CRYUN_Cryun40dG0037900 [Craigia yunnanensis]